jgi:hypothetical protein
LNQEIEPVEKCINVLISGGKTSVDIKFTREALSGQNADRKMMKIRDAGRTVEMPGKHLPDRRMENSTMAPAHAQACDGSLFGILERLLISYQYREPNE